MRLDRRTVAPKHADESGILALQDAKRNLAKAALSGDAKGVMKLSLSDIIGGCFAADSADGQRSSRPIRDMGTMKMTNDSTYTITFNDSPCG